MKKVLSVIIQLILIILLISCNNKSEKNANNMDLTEINNTSNGETFDIESEAILDSIINNIVEEAGIKHTDIVILDRDGYYYLIKVYYFGWYKGYFVDTLNNKIMLLNETPQLISLRFKYIDYLNKKTIEMIDSSNMGNGFITILDYSLNKLLYTYYYDAHADNIDILDLKKHEKIANIEYTGEVSTFFRDNNSLNIDYNFNNNGIIRIYGFRDFILSDSNGNEKIIFSQEISNFYLFNHDNNMFEIIENISTGDYFF